MTFRFHPAAEAEHLLQIQFYESRHRGLGARYRDQFLQTMDRVCKRPVGMRLRIHRIFGAQGFRARSHRASSIVSAVGPYKCSQSLIIGGGLITGWVAQRRHVVNILHYIHAHWLGALVSVSAAVSGWAITHWLASLLLQFMSDRELTLDTIQQHGNVGIWGRKQE